MGSLSDEILDTHLGVYNPDIILETEYEGPTLRWSRQGKCVSKQVDQVSFKRLWTPLPRKIDLASAAEEATRENAASKVGTSEPSATLSSAADA